MNVVCKYLDCNYYCTHEKSMKHPVEQRKCLVELGVMEKCIHQETSVTVNPKLGYDVNGDQVYIK